MENLETESKLKITVCTGKINWICALPNLMTVGYFKCKMNLDFQDCSPFRVDDSCFLFFFVFLSYIGDRGLISNLKTFHSISMFLVFITNYCCGSNGFK